MNKTMLALGVALIIAVGAGAYFVGKNSEDATVQPRQEQVQQQANKNQNDDTKGTCVADECLRDETITYPVADLPEGVQSVLATAMQDEYMARDTYQAVIDEFGDNRPFTMIVRSEEQHVSAIKAIYDKYGLDIPEANTNVTVPDSFAAACAQGVDIEQADIALYDDTVLPVVRDYPDMVKVFTNLRDASKNHLVAFEKCN